jgi:hypothetical protein
VLAMRMAACAALVGIAVSTAAAQPAVRFDDWEVGEQMQQIQGALGRFAGALRTQSRDVATATGPGGAGLVAAIEELRASAARMAGAYQPPARNATDEVVRVLEQARALEAGLRVDADAGSPGLQWAAAAESLTRLGQAYHVDWRSDPAGWTARRVSDKELRLAASSLRASASDLGEVLGAALDRDKVTDRTEKERARKQLETFTDGVRDLLKGFDHYDDLSVVLPRALRAAASLKPLMDTYGGARTAGSQWENATRALETIARGFGL